MAFVPRRLTPSTSALQAFEAVARLGSFSAAAHDLALTQGAVSRQVAVLEEQLGLILLERTSRGVVLTPSGATYAKRIAEALSIIRDASLAAMSGSEGNVLNLAILPTFGTRWLMPRIPDFIAKNPGVIVNFATRIGQFDFEVEQIDAAIYIGAPNWPGADFKLLMNETVMPVCSPDFLKAHPIRSAADMAALPLLHMASRPGAWRQWLESLGVGDMDERGMRFEQFLNVAQACIAGVGVALMPAFLIQPELTSGQLVPAFDHRTKSPSSYYLVWPRTRGTYKPLAAFREWIGGQAEAFNAGDDVVGW